MKDPADIYTSLITAVRYVIETKKERKRLEGENDS